MHHRRSQGDTKSTSSLTGSFSSIPTSNNPSSTNNTSTGRVSIYSMRERVILNKMTRMMGKLAPDTETEVTSRLHQEIPAIRLDGHLTYCFYLTLQNLIHLNVVYILLYHRIFWFDISKSHHEFINTSDILEQTPNEQTQFLRLSTEYSSVTHRAIQIHLINQIIYFSLLAVSSIELIIAFLWTLRKKLPYLLIRHDKFKYYFNRILLGMIFSVYLAFFLWLVFQTFLIRQLPLIFFGTILSHLLIITLLDKPHLFQRSPHRHLPKALTSTATTTSTSNRKPYRNSTSSSSTSSSLVANNLNRLSHRSSTSTQPRKINPIVHSPLVLPWSRWSSVLEEKLDIHECSTFYAQARQEADELWPKIVRRLILIFYRTFSSFILFDFLPMQLTGKSFTDLSRWSI